MNIEKIILEHLKECYILVRLDKSYDQNYYDLKIEAINQSCLDAMSLNRSEVKDRTLSEIYPFIFQDEKFDWIKAIKRVITTKISEEFEIFSVLFEKWIHVNLVSASENKVAIIWNDITRMKKKLTDYKQLSKYSLNYLEFEYGALEYQQLSDNIYELVNAEFVTLNIINKEKNVMEVKAVSGMDEKIDRITRIIGRSIESMEISIDKIIRDPLKQKVFKITYDELCLKLGLTEEIKEMLKDGIRIEDIWTVRIAYKDELIGSLIICMPPNVDKPDTDILSVYGSQIAILLLRKIAEEEIVYLNFHDKLTGLYNRRYVMDFIERIDTPRQYPISVIMGDANGLKLVNDAFGHAEGDKFLIKIAKIIKQSCRQEDIVSRVGGDEFIVVLPNVGNIEANIVVNRIREYCESEKNLPIKLSVALGTATKENDNQRMDLILKLAEERMYNQKMSESKAVKKEIIDDLLEKLTLKNQEMRYQIQKIIEIGNLFLEELKVDDIEKKDYILLSKLHEIGNIALQSDEKKEENSNIKEDIIDKSHVEIGFRIASASTDYANVAEYILKHHEKWNGTGYPLKIKGEEIPMVVRIFSIVDFYVSNKYDNLNENNISDLELVKIIKAKSGLDFDPKLIEIFLKNIINKIKPN